MENAGRIEIGGGMPLLQHHWSLRMIQRDWKSRRVEKARANIPSEFAADTLRYIRQAACKRAGVPEDCEVWAEGERHVAIGDVPCQRCKNPGISNYEFSAALFGQAAPNTEAKLDKDDKDALLKKDKRTIRRLINSEAPIQADDFKRAVANACMHKWLTFSQAYSIHQNILELESASSWLRRFMKRLRERVSFRTGGNIIDDPAKIASELNAELMATQEAYLKSGRHGIACALNIKKEDKQWLLRQIRVTEDAKTC